MIPNKRLLNRLNNVLRGQARIILDDRKTPILERTKDLSVIYGLKQYLNNYDEYSKVLKNYEQSKNNKDRDL